MNACRLCFLPYFVAPATHYIDSIWTASAGHFDFFFFYYDWILCVWAEFTVKFKTSKYGSFCGFLKMVQIHTYFWVKIMSGSCSVERIVHCFLRFFSKFKPSQLLSPPGQDRRAKHWQFDLPSQVSPALAAAGPVCSLLEDQSQPAPGPV